MAHWICIRFASGYGFAPKSGSGYGLDMEPYQSATANPWCLQAKLEGAPKIYGSPIALHALSML